MTKTSRLWSLLAIVLVMPAYAEQWLVLKDGSRVLGNKDPKNPAKFLSCDGYSIPVADGKLQNAETDCRHQTPPVRTPKGSKKEKSS
jgi:hypothetical protein